MKPEENNQTHNDVNSTLKDHYIDGKTIEISCVYKILSKANGLSTQNIVCYAFSPEFESFCKDCASADGIYRALRQLQKDGKVISKLRKGGYVWELIKEK